MPQTYVGTKKKKQRGFILLLHAVMLFATLGMVGLGVDAGTMYVIKGRLSSAVDAAALAAARSVNLADTVSAASAAASTTATRFFNANFPNGYLGTGTVVLTPPSFTQQTNAGGTPTGLLTVAVTASVPAPTYFMQIFGIRTVNVAASGSASRRATVMMLVLDVSSSMNQGSSPTPCDTMKTAAQQFITNFSPYDTIGAVAFNYTSTLIYAPTSSFGDGSLNTALGNISCSDNTNTTSALYLAYEQIKSVGLPLAYNSIVLFTDGSPNAINAVFPVRTQSDVRYGPDVAGACPSSSATCTMPVVCTGSASQTVTGTIVQGAGQTDTGASTGLWRPISTDAWAVAPTSCASDFASPNASVRQEVAYIPDFDKYGNSTHGVPATSTPPTCPGSTCTVSMVTLKSTGASYTYDTRDFWEFQVNNVCASSSGTAAAYCAETQPTANQQYEGGVWSSYPNPPTLPSSGSNFFTSGPYKGYLRPDQPTTIVAASMNTAMAEAYWIRADASGCGTNGTACATKYNTVINTIYLLGTAGDQADHEFLPIIANTQTISALPYDTNWTPYTNPAFQSNQQQGLYQVTADKTQLTALFQKLASQVIRLSK